MNPSENKAPASPAAEPEPVANPEQTVLQPAEVEIAGRRFHPKVARHLRLGLFTAARILFEGSSVLEVQPSQLNAWLWDAATSISEALAAVEQDSAELDDGYLHTSFTSFDSPIFE